MYYKNGINPDLWLIEAISAKRGCPNVGSGKLRILLVMW